MAFIGIQRIVPGSFRFLNLYIIINPIFIYQCFGHELFEYPSCQHDLAFNQLTGVCDYPANVLGCSQADGNDQMDFTILEAAVDLPNDVGQQGIILKYRNF